MDTEKVNGFGILFRFITPFMVAISVVMMTYISTDIRNMKLSLDNHLQHDVSEIKERLARIETILERKLP